MRFTFFYTPSKSPLYLDECLSGGGDEPVGGAPGPERPISPEVVAVLDRINWGELAPLHPAYMGDIDASGLAALVASLYELADCSAEFASIEVDDALQLLTLGRRAVEMVLSGTAALVSFTGHFRTPGSLRAKAGLGD
jgi:hypothetical protein